MIREQVIYKQDYDGLKMQRWPECMPNMVGEFAMQLVQSWGLVVGKSDNEDSAGRAVMAVMPVEEVVSRACDLAEGTFAELEKRGLLTEIDDIETARDKAREERGRN